MKKLLILLLALLPLLSQAQRIDNPRTVVRSCEKCTDVLYYVKVIVPAYTYSPDSTGRVRFQRDILAGKFDLYTDAGVKIPIGTKPPRIMPTGGVTTPVNPATGPTWASLRESLNSAGLFYLEAAGTEIARLKVERTDGTALAGRNDENPSLPGNTFYGYGANPGQGLYDRQWKFYFTPGILGQSIKLTLERTNGETFAYTFTPTLSDRTVLFTASTSTGTPVSTTTTTLPVFSRGLIVGNSITLSGPIDNTLWQFRRGMAATMDGKDFAGLMLNQLRTANANFSLAIQNQGAGLERVYMNNNDDVKNNITNLLYELNQKYGDVVFDFVYIAISENVDAGQWNETMFRSMLDRLIAAIPKTSNCTILLRNSLWANHDASDAFIRAYAAEKGYKFADMAPIKENAAYMTLLSQTTPGPYNNKEIDHHPNDAGMAKKADISLAAISGTTTIVVPTQPTTPTSSTYAFANPNPDYQPVADQGLLSQTETFFTNNVIKIGILDAGGVISTARLVRDNRGLINTSKVFYDDEPADPRYNTFTYDLGRSRQSGSDYFTPGPSPDGYVFKNGKSTKTGYTGRPGSRSEGQHIFNTGGNTVQAGSLWPALTKSPVLASARYTHPVRGEEIYVKTRPAIWGVKGELGHIIIEDWINLKSNYIHVYTRHTVEERDAARVAEQRTFSAVEQENPCLWIIAPLTQQLINLPGETRKNIWPGIGRDVTFSPTYHVADNRIGAYEGDGGTGVTYYSPMNSSVKSGQNAAGTGATGGDEYSDPCAYLNAALRMNYDNPGIYDDESYTILGTESEASQTISTLPGIDQSFSFDFARENMRWWNVDSRLKRESGNQWTWYLDSKTDNNVTSYQCKLQSPYRAWAASGINTVSFELAVTGASQLDLIWSKPGPDNGPEYSKRFSVTGDGQFRTYTVSTSDANWSGILSSIGLKAVTGGTSPGAKVILRKIYKN